MFKYSAEICYVKASEREKRLLFNTKTKKREKPFISESKTS